MMMLMNSYW